MERSGNNWTLEVCSGFPVFTPPLFLQSQLFPNPQQEGFILVGAALRLFPPTQLPFSYQAWQKPPHPLCFAGSFLALPTASEALTELDNLEGQRGGKSLSFMEKGLEWLRIIDPSKLHSHFK